MLKLILKFSVTFFSIAQRISIKNLEINRMKYENIFKK